MSVVSNTGPLSICVGCGLCCDGTLHERADVSPEDEAGVLAAGLKVTKVQGKSVFLQPCPRFAGDGCTIYPARPGVCRKYRCQLRKAVDEGQIAESEARERIAEAKTRLAAVLAIDPRAKTPALRKALWRRLRDHLPSLPEERAAAKKAMLAIGSLDYLLEAHFRRRT